VTVLNVDQLTLAFGGLQAVSGFNLILNQGELVGLIGPNGAGKTTVFNLLTGVYRPDNGRILLYTAPDTPGRNIAGFKPHQITRLGLARTFQNIRLFKELSVIDNVKIGYHFKVQYQIGDAVLRTPRYFQEEQAIREQALALLQIFNLQHKAAEYAKNLPYGEQRKLEIVRALAVQPRLLLLDEPAAGMNPQETRELMQLIRFVRERFALTILLIEHDMHLVMEICERIVVLDYGQTIAEGTPEQISRNPRVIKAYLGAGVNI